MKASFMVGADTKDDTATNNGGGGIRNVHRHLDRWPEDSSLRVVVDNDYSQLITTTRQQHPHAANGREAVAVVC